MDSLQATGEPVTRARLTAALGDPAAPGHPFAAATLAELDETAAFPARACAALDEAGLHRYYVPARHGGALTGLLDLVRLLRVVASRDLSVAIAHGKTLLGAASVWVAGDEAQAAELAARVLAGSRVSWGLTEREHGSDLLASELTASETAAGWRLDGEKWLINNATRGDEICVFARTSPPGGARGFSLFLVDKRALADGAWRPLPKIRTHGIRGADISGIVFDGAVVPPDALVGGTGDGLEIVLKALQLTRITCTALSLGAADHALRIVAGFAAERKLYGRTLGELPETRRSLGEAGAAVLVAEAVSVLAARGAQALPAELSVLSAIAKAFVPTLIQDSLNSLAELIGARGFLSRAYAEGRFAKLERDHRIVGIFDGSTAVNRNALIGQFPRLARGARTRSADEEGLRAAATLDAPLDAFDPTSLWLVSARGCSVLQGLPGMLSRLEAAGPASVLPLVQALAAVTDELHRELAELAPAVKDVPAESFDLAARYELCFAGAACLALWLHNPDRHDDPLWPNATWLRAALRLVLARLGMPTDDDGSFDVLAAAALDGTPLSLLADGEDGR